MEYIFIDEKEAENIRKMEFDGYNKLDPILGEFEGKQVYFLQAELKKNPTFEKVIKYFDTLEVRKLEVGAKYFDKENNEVRIEERVDEKTGKRDIAYVDLGGREVDHSDCTERVILTEVIEKNR